MVLTRTPTSGAVKGHAQALLESEQVERQIHAARQECFGPRAQVSRAPTHAPTSPTPAGTPSPGLPPTFPCPSC
jgi:hypothetical protein